MTWAYSPSYGKPLSGFFADYQRVVMKLRFQPIYNIVMNLRHKWQGRLGSNWLTPMSYDQVE